MALSPGPGNKMWNTSSQPITFSLDSGTAPTKRLPNVTGSTLGAQTFPDAEVSPTRYLATSSMTIVDENVLTPDPTPQTSRAASSSDGGSRPFPSTSPPKWLSLPHTSTGPQEPDSAVSWIPTDAYTSGSSDASLTSHDVIIRTTKEFPDVLTTANGTTKIKHGHVTGITVNKPRDGMSWPVAVATLLFFCILLFGLGVRKWCQYQKEIMERPPPFKPPPPPIKYMCIQEPTGRGMPCHEMEVL